MTALDKDFRNCVHCGMCLSTCPTYLQSGNEADSPRGRIYIMKSLLQEHQTPEARQVWHLDRCLGCLACETTCPSGVSYRTLLEAARTKIEGSYRRPLWQRVYRWMIPFVIMRPRIFYLLSQMSRAVPRSKSHKWQLATDVASLAPLRAMLDFQHPQLNFPRAAIAPKFDNTEPVGARVLLFQPCAQKSLRPSIDQALLSVLARLNIATTVVRSQGCCGAITHHLGQSSRTSRAVSGVLSAMSTQLDNPQSFDAILTTSSGCISTMLEYPALVPQPAADDDRQRAQIFKKRAHYCTYWLNEFTVDRLPKARSNLGAMTIAYHSPCSLRHGLRQHTASIDLLRRLGFSLHEPRNAHLCCGSAGIYNILQPEMAAALGQQKAKHLTEAPAWVIATDNLGCMEQIYQYEKQVPIFHTIELIDWALGSSSYPELDGLLASSLAHDRSSIDA